MLFKTLLIMSILMGVTACGGGSGTSSVVVNPNNGTPPNTNPADNSNGTTNGSGDGSGTTPPPTAADGFPLRAAFSNYIANPQPEAYEQTFVTTARTQTGTLSVIPVIKAGIFENQTVITREISTDSRLSGTDGSSSNQTSTYNDFYTSDYRYAGSIDSFSYTVATTSTALPDNIKTGDTLTYYQAVVFSDNTKTRQTATDNATLTASTFDSNHLLITLTQTRTPLDNSQASVTTHTYTLSVNGVLTPTGETVSDTTGLLTVALK